MDRSKTLPQKPGASLFAWLGFGLFLVTYGGGPFGYISGSAEHTVAWGALLLAQTAFFFGAALGCLLVGTVVQLPTTRPVQILATGAYVAVVLLGLAAQPVLGSIDAGAQTAARSVLSLLAGIFYASPLFFWTERFRYTAGAPGRFGQFALLVACYVLTPVVVLAASLLDFVPYVYSIAMAACAVGCAAIQLLYFGDCNQPDSTTVSDRTPYRLTTYSASVLVGFGFSWGICDAASLLVLADSLVSQTASNMLVASALIAAALIVTLVRRSRKGPKFGMLVRVLLVVCAAQLVALPLEFETAPALIYPLSNIAMIAAEVALIVFSIDVCNEEGRAFAPAFAKNFATLMGTSCVSSVLFYAAHLLLSEHVAWLAASVIAMWVILAAVLFLPSRSSDAAVLTNETLPENEGYEANVAMRRERMSHTYHLSEGEAEVLTYVLQSMRREQIAEKLGLSPWTVKARTSAIYRKCGVHSYKELMQLVASEE